MPPRLPGLTDNTVKAHQISLFVPGASSAPQLCPPPLYLWCRRPAGAECETVKKKNVSLLFCRSSASAASPAAALTGGAEGRVGWGGWERVGLQRERRRRRHGHPGPRAQQMPATTCSLTPVRVLESRRKQPAEKFMTPEGSCPPSEAACALPPPPSHSSLFWTAPAPPSGSPRSACYRARASLTGKRLNSGPGRQTGDAFHRGDGRTRPAPASGRCSQPRPFRVTPKQNRIRFRASFEEEAPAWRRKGDIFPRFVMVPAVFQEAQTCQKPPFVPGAVGGGRDHIWASTVGCRPSLGSCSCGININISRVTTTQL